MSEIRRLDTVIDAKLAERDALYEMLLHITPTLKQDVVSSGGFQQDKMSNAIAKIVDLDKELNDKIDRLVDHKREADMLMEEVSKRNLLHYKILVKRYIEDKTWAQIASEMGYSDTEGAKKLHGRALQTFDQILKAHKEEGA